MSYVALGLCVAAVLTICSWHLMRARSGCHDRFYIPSVLACGVGGVSALGLRAVSTFHAPTPWLIVACGLLTVGSIGLAAQTTSQWRGMMADNVMLASSVTLMVVMTTTALTGTPPTRALVIDAIACACVVIAGMAWITYARLQQPFDPGRVVYLKSYGLLLSFGSLPMVVGTAIASRPLYVLGELTLLVSFIPLGMNLWLRMRNGTLGPIRVAGRPRPSPVHYAAAVGTSAVGLLMATLEESARNPLTIGFVLLSTTSIVARQVITLHDHDSLRRQAQAQEQQFSTLLHNSSDAILAADRATGAITFANPTAMKCLATSSTELLGEHLWDIVKRPSSPDPSTTHPAEGGNYSIQLGTKRFDVTITHNDDTTLATLTDVTEFHALGERLQAMATRDEVTGLMNRATILDTLRDCLQRPSRYAALLFIDLDRFKQVNDACGHQAGDEVLVQVATRLAGVVEPHAEALGRLGDDEFAAVIADDSVNLADLAGRVCKALQRPFILGDRHFQLGGSIGIATSLDADDPADLMQWADIAMFAAKRGHQHFVQFRPELHEEVVADVKRDAVVALACNRQDFALFLQPIVATGTGAVQYAEALIRWRNDMGQLQSPWQLIDFAERTGQLHVITSWVIQESLTVLASAPSPIGLSFNAPPVDLLTPGFADNLTRAADAAGIATHRITVEITENALIAEAGTTYTVLHQLRDNGFRLAVDDFGSGYASLGYLVNLPITTVKLDRRFITQAPTNSTARELITQLAGYCSEHQVTLVAEGVETAEEHRLMLELGCPYAQGYFYAMPQLAQECGDLTQLPLWRKRTGELSALRASGGAVVT